MAITPFAFDPPTGWNDPTTFPTYEVSEVKVRSDMQLLHNQTRDYINNTIVAKLDQNVNNILLVSTTVDSLPKTINNAAISVNHELLRAELGTPAAQTGQWTVTTSNGKVKISGSISGSTTVRLVLGIVGNSI